MFYGFISLFRFLMRANQVHQITANGRQGWSQRVPGMLAPGAEPKKGGMVQGNNDGSNSPGGDNDILNSNDDLAIDLEMINDVILDPKDVAIRLNLEPAKLESLKASVNALLKSGYGASSNSNGMTAEELKIAQAALGEDLFHGWQRVEEQIVDQDGKTKKIVLPPIPEVPGGLVNQQAAGTNNKVPGQLTDQIIKESERQKAVVHVAPNYTIPTTPPDERASAAFVVLCRNKDLDEIRRSMRELEDRFNRRYKYPYVFINDVPFSQAFKKAVSESTEALVEFGTTEPGSWEYPPWIDRDVADMCRAKMKADGVIYGGNLPYRHMCRW
ncbi:alpha 1,2-mannosyltransferase 2.4.1 [Blyttiomyces sp. JEL0837]|nr:alpha 1,2-mannosyltransferase 2.4.1 [Blyttiomyces sp. JEL0837]